MLLEFTYYMCNANPNFIFYHRKKDVEQKN